VLQDRAAFEGKDRGQMDDDLDLTYGEDEHRVSQTLALFREHYMSVPREERKAARKWLNDLRQLLEKPPAGLPQIAKLVTAFAPVPNEECSLYASTISLATLARAIKAWDREQLYLPDMHDWADDGQ
jgi:hypothetical protein